jgi:Zn-dependent peptidase ImmA (M78 family)
MTARDFLNRYWGESIPVDPVAIARAVGLRVEPLSPDVADTFSGEYAPDDPMGAVIRYNPNHTLSRQRFTIAHELGHHALGHGLSYRDDNPENFSIQGSDWAEVAANKFASELLMPLHILDYLIEHEKNLTLSKLANCFGVSEAAMYWRMKNLRMLDHE